MAFVDLQCIEIAMNAYPCEVNTADEKCTEGLNIFLFYFELKFFECCLGHR